MDWSGIATAYLDRERARLGLPTRVEEAALRAKREQEAAAAASELESQSVGRDLTRARLAALPAEAEQRRRLVEAQIRNYDEPNRAARLTPHYVEDAKGNVRAITPSETGFDVKNLGAIGTPQRELSSTLLPFLTGGGYIDRRTGKPLDFERPETAEQVNKRAGRTLASHSVNVVKTLGDRIITKIGPEQRIAALARGAESVYGTDPEFKAYQDARMALAGNLAVAQQGSRPSDADIRAIWLPMVPDAYSDTSESAAIKWDLIQQMQAGPTGMTDTQPASVASDDPLEGRTATNKAGQKVVRKGGQWVPLQ